jgi:hypothetical protein
MAEKEMESAGFKEAGFASKEVNVKESAAKLVKFGGFKAVESAIKGTGNLNPDSKAKRDIFLKDGSKKAERESLKATLNLWGEVLSQDASFSELIGKCEQMADSTGENLRRNLKSAVEETRNLETSWRSLNAFFKNTENENVKNLTILNASMEQLQDLDNPVFIDAVAEELNVSYDSLDLRNHYSMVNVPGYLGSKPVLEKWGKIVHKNKAFLVTDFENLEDAEGVMDFFTSADLASGDDFKSNTVMACNYLVARPKDTTIEEEEDVYIPPSAALVGNMYKTDMAQVAAGVKHGKVNEVFGTRFKLKKQAELTPLEKMGLVPMVNEYNSVFAMSGRTLFTGDMIGKQNYPPQRCFDYIMKTLMDFLNRRAFENYDMETFQDIKKQLVKFLDGITDAGKGGPNVLLEKYVISKFERDPRQKDRVYLNLTLSPKFAMKNFVISMDGLKGDDGTEWNNDVKQS